MTRSRLIGLQALLASSLLMFAAVTLQASVDDPLDREPVLVADAVLDLTDRTIHDSPGSAPTSSR